VPSPHQEPLPEAVLVLTTVPSAEAGDQIAHALVAERLAACVNVLPAMTSVYRWQGVVQRDTEHQLVIKTTRGLLAALQARLDALHPYELPELLVVPVEGGSPAYLAWVATTADS
jgi:periplasmic divalent cation tolerance protein